MTSIAKDFSGLQLNPRTVVNGLFHRKDLGAKLIGDLMREDTKVCIYICRRLIHYIFLRKLSFGKYSQEIQIRSQAR
jgi:hypothetical protein